MTPYYETPEGIIYQGDALSVLKSLPDEAVHCVVTSPPYWGLRDYGLPPMIWDSEPADICEGGRDHVWGDASWKNPNASGGWQGGAEGGIPNPGQKVADYQDRKIPGQFCQICGAWRGCLGLEPTPELYIKHVVEIFREAWRVLRADGTCWLNLGDSYNAARDGGHAGGLKGVSKPENAPKRSGVNAPGLKPKDLIGIPWAVAKALQQPYYTGKIKSVIDRAWMAGIVDGEGCITVLETTSPHNSGNSYPPILQVRMCDEDAILRITKITGLGKLSPKQEPPSQIGQRPSYHWRQSARKAVDLIAEIYPHLTVKRKQAVIAWNHQIIRESYHTKRGVKIPPEKVKQQMFCKELIQKANKGERVDIPSWMKEPEAKMEPGWYLRSDCIWHKPNPMPESVTDRPTKAHEYLFLLTKSAKYFYDNEAIKEPSNPDTHLMVSKSEMERISRERSAGANTNVGMGSSPKCVEPNGMIKQNKSFRNAVCLPVSSRNKRTVWTIPTKPFPKAHFATFPPALIEPCILAGTSERGCCVECGSPWERVVDRKILEPLEDKPYQDNGQLRSSGTKAGHGTHHSTLGGQQNKVASKTIGWQPTCKCYGTELLPEYPELNKDENEAYQEMFNLLKIEPIRFRRQTLLDLWKPLPTIPCTVLDPFGGSMTTAIVSHKYSRKFIMIELSKAYINDIGIPRIEKETEQLKLFN